MFNIHVKFDWLNASDANSREKQQQPTENHKKRVNSNKKDIQSESHLSTHFLTKMKGFISDETS